MPATKPKIREELCLVPVGEEAVVLDPRTGVVHYMNPMAALVLQLCDGTATVTETIRELADAYEVEPQEIEKQMRGLVRQFRKSALVTPSRVAEAILAMAEPEDEREKIRREVPRSD
jgi:PqqD family protein of HPr-rel-A system